MLDILTQASHQWATRPADQRFLNLHDLLDRVSAQRIASSASVVSKRRILAAPDQSGGRVDHQGLVVYGADRDAGAMAPTHFAFGQLARLAGAPAGYLRNLPTDLAADCINYGLRAREIEEVGLLRTDMPGATELRAATGPNYGRVWNQEIVQALVDRFGDGVTGQWKVPGEFGKDVPITLQNTTIYGSDRDVFVFLADEHNRLEVADRRGGQPGSVARGFFVWNSEVGDKTIGAAFFLFDYVCKNRIVWGVREFRETRIRHTAGAPDRWLEEITPVLAQYAESAAGPIEAQIRAAQQKKIDDVQEFLATRFSAGRARQFMAAHEREEDGRPIETVWDAVTAVTAFARSIEWTDERVEMEREGGKLLDLVAA